MKKIYLQIIGLLLLTPASLLAQHAPHYSMFNENQLFINPATAGFFEDNLRLFTGFRSQWMSVSDQPYRTISASADWRMLDEMADGSGNFMGGGIAFYNDAAGASLYSTNIISIPLNYAIQIGQADHFSIGLQPSFYQRTLTGSDLTWDNQWTGVTFNQDLASNESLLSQNASINRFDFAAGVYWEKQLSRYAKFTLGMSGQHLTKPNVNILSNEERMYRKLNLHGQAEFSSATSNVTYLPAFYGFVQGPNSEITFGSGFRFQLKGESRSTSYFENIRLTMGGYFRVGDAIIVNSILELSKFSLGASYDMNISGLNTASNSVGAVEFFLRYRFIFGDNQLRHNRIKK
jgi:type IX secretion system PorP/SprF family membrane protein